MEYLSIHQISKQLSIPKDTLRYYDKIKLVCPKRGENKYRYYTESNILELEYIEVMKNAGFSLHEIKQVLANKAGCTEENLNDTMNLINSKKEEIKRYIMLYHSVLQLLSEAEAELKQKKAPDESEKINQLVHKIFKELKGAGDDEK